MTDNPRCYICGDAEETTLHILRDCPAARLIWNKLGGPAEQQSFYQAHMKQWITANCSGGGSGHEDIWATYFGTTLWWLWR